MTDIAAAYRAGATVRELATEHGLHESTIRYQLRAAGVERRPIGRRPEVDVERIVTLRRRHKLSWEQVAAAAGCSKTAARRAYERATGNRGQLDHHKHLTAKQADRLIELWRAVPDQSNGNGRATHTSHEGQRLVEQIRAHVDAGVTQREIADALGLTTHWVRYVLRDD